MLRDKWGFQFTTSTLLRAATDKAKHHADRLKWWEGQQKTIMVECRKKGLSVEESVGAAYSTSNAAFGAQITVDTTFQRKLAECHMKINEHRTKAEMYRGWVQVFEANKGQALELHADDYLFFYGR